MDRDTRRARPTLEALEGRQLLNARTEIRSGEINDKDLQRFLLQRDNDVPVSDRRINYTTPEGSRVTLTLYGRGSLEGTTVSPGGVLHLVYRDTDASSGIVTRVSGGSGRALLGSLHDGNTDILNISGVGASRIGVVNLTNFDLVDNGNINLSAGVNKLFLRSVGRNTQIHLRENPQAATTEETQQDTTVSSAQVITGTSGTGTAVSGTTGAVTGATTNVTGGGTGTTGTGTTGTGTTGTGGTSGLAGASSTINTVGGAGFLAGGTAVLPGTGNTSAVTEVVVSGEGPTGGQTSLGTATGIDVVIGTINGRSRTTPALGDPQIFGYDPVANALIRFDVASGVPLQAIPLPGTGSPVSGVGMGRDDGRLVALVGVGQTVMAFDAVTGDPRGQFTTANLFPADEPRAIEGIGMADPRTAVTFAPAADEDDTEASGSSVLIDVTQSLATGQAVATASAFTPQREFLVTGGLTGVAGTDTLFATGGAHFDTFQPNEFQFGILGIGTAGNRLREASRTAVSSPSSIINVNPSAAPNQALGSLDQQLALITDNNNTFTLYNQSTLAVEGRGALSNPNRLTGLSESFHPELVDTALIDVRGNLRSFRATEARGLVLNDTGTLSLVQIQKAVDSVIVGRPVAHVRIPDRQNVVLASTTRIDTVIGSLVGDRSGVNHIDPNLRVIGPLSLPDPRKPA